MISIHEQCPFEKVGYAQYSLFQNETVVHPQVFLKYEIYRISLEKIFISLSNLIL
jgi:hypothetical protein